MSAEWEQYVQFSTLQSTAKPYFMPAELVLSMSCCYYHTRLCAPEAIASVMHGCCMGLELQLQDS